ncbi:uncharacterized protein Z520_06272 [Fonsecaea multimorphosa CBS 102226]|uniref:Uncharacterized protein n=1 Tax=Fonsecaea multimorphosa CBS 102226 TaxID=1442371 RepID=A0A0D2JXA0_9EURO|nr:uncharacterized protein Z520_06272 [Fonsecaea multimorphosa CBS 102226]KIX98192.1 hypothetical protein Z520_06272 [Fonsecaea multimorphosa CBS 102226]
MAPALTDQSTVMLRGHIDLPTLFHTRNNTEFQPSKNISLFISSEMDVSRLDEMIDRGLPLAGRLGNIRPLHRQRVLGRRIVITEQLDLHLLWKGDTMFIKPLPGWLLDEDFVKAHISHYRQAESAANGFLASYARLINYKSDFQLAKEAHLLPEGMEWKDWQALSERLIEIDHQMRAGKMPCSPRFEFGELRLSRINMIYRFHPTYHLRHMVRGYHYSNMTYQSFLRRNFAWLVVVFAYLTIILTAMQVGLGTSQLRNNRSFNNASYGFAVFAIVLPLVALGMGMLVSLFLTVYHVRVTREHLRARHAVSDSVKGGCA